MASEISNERSAVMEYLATSNSIIKMSVGAVVGGICRHNVIVVHEACPRVVRDIVENFEMVSLKVDGLHIPVHDSSGS